jgi:group I intron endonuclease
MIVYKATNTVNGKVYIGKTVCKLNKRKCRHLQDAKRGATTFFHRAIRKHGEDVFVWEVVYSGTSDEDLLAQEVRLISEHKSNQRDFGYNLTAGGEGCAGCRPSEETRERMSAWQIGRKHSPEALAKRTKSRAGFQHSEATRKKMGDAHRGKPFSDERKARIAAALRGKVKSPEHREKLRLAAIARNQQPTST